ncbi:hypothetical protein HK099_008290 [Clydaea vesicula]|uniref:NADP-dependent oxidoreductase domain-containing protein n=1 Tax=Clydaea vesicula TaxID=447962 RepID=A0AAD5U822_9FUNG|nr:hypothetical protein HK099_008290 [Clydaea vesicula]KAJ3397168.1 hypothetical protein HDU92_000473 [Lobulomyces angularis]
MQKIEVPLRTLNDGNKIPVHFNLQYSYIVLTFGAGTRWKTEGNCNFVQEGVIQAVQLGFTSIDNAEIYNTEKEVGHALNSLSPLDRNRLFISSKVLKNLDNIEQACRESLRNLNLDYLDLYLIHSPFFKNFCSTVSLEEAWLKMELLVEKGLVKSIGVSNFR